MIRTISVHMFDQVVLSVCKDAVGIGGSRSELDISAMEENNRVLTGPAACSLGSCILSLHHISYIRHVKCSIKLSICPPIPT
jgi:hypothetical protein